MKRLLAKLVPMQRGELVTVGLLTLNVFVLLTCYYVLKVVREPLILLGGGAELKAYASAGQTMLLLAVVPAFGWLSARVSRIRLLTTIAAHLHRLSLAFYVLAQARAPIGLAFYLWLGIFNVLVVSNFWSFATDLYSPRSGKRLFATIGVGAASARCVGAFVPHAAASTARHRRRCCWSPRRTRPLDRAVPHRRSPRAPPAHKEDRPRSSTAGSAARDFSLVSRIATCGCSPDAAGRHDHQHHRRVRVGKMATDRAKIYAAEQAEISPPGATPDARAAATHDAENDYIGGFYTRTCTEETRSARSASPGSSSTPDPLVGEREIDGVGLLRNADSRTSVRRWLDAFGELGLDRERARGWGVAHALAWAWDADTGWSAWSVEAARRILAT